MTLFADRTTEIFHLADHPILRKTSEDSKSMMLSALSNTFRVTVMIRVCRNIKSCDDYHKL